MASLTAEPTCHGVKYVAYLTLDEAEEGIESLRVKALVS